MQPKQLANSNSKEKIVKYELIHVKSGIYLTKKNLIAVLELFSFLHSTGPISNC